MKAVSSLLMAMALTCASVHATTYSLAGNWNSSTDSASNLWAYGTFSSGTVFTVPSTATNNGSSSVDFWNFPPAGATDQSDPNIEKNLTSSDVVSSTSGIDFRAGTVSFGPYQGPAVAQFTAPSAGLYTISATFQTDQIRSGSTSDGTTAYVYVGGVSKLAQQLTDPGSAQFGAAVTYSASNVALSAGELVDFAVGGGAFTTQVDATLTVPEPSTWALLLGSAGMMIAFARRRALSRVP